MIGYSDGNGFSVQVGPRPAGKGEKGQFDGPSGRLIEGLTGFVTPGSKDKEKSGCDVNLQVCFHFPLLFAYTLLFFLKPPML